MSTAPHSPGSTPVAHKPPARAAQTPTSANEKRDPGKTADFQACAHPRVQVVAREEDAEFVECVECREVFESSEFRDMAIEEKIQDSPDE